MTPLAFLQAAETAPSQSASSTLGLAFGIALLVIVCAAAAAVLWNIFTGKIDLTFLLCGDDDRASMGRFQFLIFTFVIAFSYFYVVASDGKLPAIPTEVLTLLGISASTYAVGKGIDQSGGSAPPDNPPEDKK